MKFVFFFDDLLSLSSYIFTKGEILEADRCTSEIRVELCPGDYVTISASRYPFANVMQQGRRSEDWVNSISRTLNWNSRQRQKGFKEWQGGEKRNTGQGKTD